MPPNKRRALASRVKRKRKFFGIRKQDIASRLESDARPSDDVEPSSSFTPTSSVQSRTAQKLLNSSFEELNDSMRVLTRRSSKKLGLSKQKQIEQADGFTIIDLSLLQEALQSSTNCRACKRSDSQLKILKDSRKKHGLAETLIIKCSCCSAETIFHTSKKLDKGKFEVNTRSVMACNSLKGGRKILSNFCGMMNLPSPLTSASYARQLKSSAKISREVAEKQMKDAANRLKKSVLEQNPNAYLDDMDDTVSVAVSVDGTWQKRGYSSKYGVVVVVLMETGEVVDFEVLSMHCHECRKHQHENKDSEAFKRWKAKHDASCQINYEGSSGGMEGIGAARIFLRSIEGRGLKYTTFIGDGDSDTFKVVSKELERAYGSRYQVVKEECIGHIQKRMGNALRTLLKEMKGKKMSDGKTIGGKGRLTKERIDSFQRYFGNSIRANRGNLAQMQNDVWAIFHHSVMPATASTLNDQHKFCPKGKDSWCKFNAELITGKKSYDGSKRLPSSFFDILEPIFKRLTSKDLLERCLRGVTQNANESLNHMIWERCPKATFCSKVRIESAVSEAVCCFNTGAGSRALMLKEAGIEDIGEESLKSLQKEDHIRQISAAQKVTSKYKSWRISRKRTKTNMKRSEKEHYEPGAFDSRGEKPISTKRRKRNQYSDCSKQNKVDQSVSDDVITDIPITFAVPLENIVKI
ncbi:uncharacterized protein LOC135691614 [Rhopilema esculentum]|uniref:uncharacterized protein LOC135691614 n=1 Tax=Rhopilema esculentum TaxID=499914 RepID=UPI0031D80639